MRSTTNRPHFQAPLFYQSVNYQKRALIDISDNNLDVTPSKQVKNQEKSDPTPKDIKTQNSHKQSAPDVKNMTKPTKTTTSVKAKTTTSSESESSIASKKDKSTTTLLHTTTPAKNRKITASSSIAGMLIT